MKSRQLSFLLLAILLVYYYRTNAQTATLPAVVDVSAIGAATYSIPIDVVPGTGGMQPSLSITYNSLGGLGNMGYKWSLEGISSISRVPQSLYYDGNVRPISFDTSDRFALDGKRLILLSGSSYHAANAVYGHEVEDFSRIARTWDGLNNYFVDTLADGRIAYYGLTSNSRFIVYLDVVAWLLEKITDGNGNYMTFSYSFENGEILLNQIDYTLNDSANISSFATVQLSYSNIGQANDKYIYGKKLRQYNILKNINILYRNNLIRHYKLSYYEGVNNGKLSMISLYGRDNNLLSTTTISWDTALIVSSDNYFGLPSGYTIVAGNYNGDRLYDLFLAKNGNFSFRTRNTEGSFSSTSVTCQYPNEIVYSTMTACDINNDGIDEILYSDYPNTFSGYRGYFILHPNVSPNAVLTRDTILYGYNLSQPYIGDFDGDGRLEIIVLADYNALKCYGVEGLENNTNQSLPNYYTRAATGDFDGDGKTDIMLIRDGDYSIYSYNITSHQWTHIETLSNPNFCTQLQIGDFNGDGMSDILYHTGSSSLWNIAIRKGWSAWAISTVSVLIGAYSSSTGLPIYSPIVIDVNGDGKSDILQTTSDEQMILLSSLGVFQEVFQYTQQNIGKYSSQKFDQCSLSIGDFDGNGLIDILFNYPTNGNNPTSIKYFYPQNKSLDFVRNITDALGKETRFEYSPISLMPNNGYGMALHWAQLPLVRLMATSNGIGGYDTTFYLYGNVQFDTDRNQFIGFSNFATRLNHIVTEHYFSKVRRDYSDNYTFGYLMPDSIITRYSPIPTSVAFSPYSGTGLFYGPNDTTISIKTYTNMSLSRNSASGTTIFFPYTLSLHETNNLRNTHKQTSVLYSSQTWLLQTRSTIFYDSSITKKTRLINEIYSYSPETLANSAHIWLPSQIVSLSTEGMNNSVQQTDTIKNLYIQGLPTCTTHSIIGGLNCLQI